jgi:hypothetical protein
MPEGLLLLVMKAVRHLGRFFHNLCIPHEHNNYKARLAHPYGLFSLQVALIGLQVAMQFVIWTPGFPKILGYAADISVAEVIRLTNEKRAEHGLAPLKEDSTLSSTAYLKGQHMIERDYWAHVSPDGTEPWFFFRQGGYVYRYAGENLARDFTDAESAVDAWMASPTHRENILSDRYKDIGIAVVEGDVNEVDTTIIVQFLGTRLADTLPTTPIAQTGNEGVSSPTPAPIPVQKEIAGSAAEPEVKVPVLISPFVTTKGVSIATLLLLLVIFVLDAAITTRRKIRRTGGRVFAHIAFLGMILAIMIILRAGEVL